MQKYNIIFKRPNFLQLFLDFFLKNYKTIVLVEDFFSSRLINRLIQFIGRLMPQTLMKPFGIVELKIIIQSAPQISPRFAKIHVPVSRYAKVSR